MLINDPKELMHARIRGQCDLAVTYAEDGAYITALRVLEKITAEVKEHVQRLREQGLY